MAIAPQALTVRVSAFHLLLSRFQADLKMLVGNLLGLAPPVPKGEQILEQAWAETTATPSLKNPY